MTSSISASLPRLRRARIAAILLASTIALGGCSNPPAKYSRPLPLPLPPSPQPTTGPALSESTLKSLPETVGVEYQDRIKRLQRLSTVAGIDPPSIDELQIPKGRIADVDYAVPVIRVRFDERVFFDFDKDVIRSDAEEVIGLIAENMRRDVPDAQLTILGHTDARGTEAYNVDLSKRRAASVMQALYRRGVRLSQMSTVAVGEAQPIAPNSTDEGRAHNRRVEFMISANEQANLALVKSRRIDIENLQENPAEPVDAKPAQMTVMHPVAPVARQPDKTSLELAPVATIEGQKPKPEAEIRKLAPQPDPRVMTPRQVNEAILREEFNL